MDILPFIFQIIHPNTRDINKHERNAFQTSIEIMVMFDLKLMPPESDDPTQLNYRDLNRDPNVALFEPDITSLVMFKKGGRKEFMRQKT